MNLVKIGEQAGLIFTGEYEGIYPQFIGRDEQFNQYFNSLLKRQAEINDLLDGHDCHLSDEDSCPCVELREENEELQRIVIEKLNE